MNVNFKNYLNCVKPLIQVLDDELYEVFDSKKEYYSYKWFPKKHNLNDYIKEHRVRVIPCKQCLPCLNIKRYKWVLKLKAERKKWKKSYFITLTYNNDNNTGELNSYHLKCFFDNLDYLLSDKSRNWKKTFKREKYYKFMAAGEYGSKTERPHYHIVLLTNYSIPDLIFLKNSRTGPLYISSTISKLWNNKGWVYIGQDYGQGESFGYTVSYSNKNYLKQRQLRLLSQRDNKINIIHTNYCLGHYDGLTSYVMIDNIISVYDTYIKRCPEFLSFSRRPPIGSDTKDYNIVPTELLKWIQKNGLITEDDFIKIDDEIQKRKRLMDDMLINTDINSQILNNNIGLEKLIIKNKNAKGTI